jgi:PAS domain S-box-containing protein
VSRNAIKKLLLVEDDPGDARLLREMFSERDSGSQGTELTHVQSLRAAEEHLSEREVDIVLLDLGLPDAHGLTGVRRAQAVAPRVPLVVLTGLDDESLAAQALQEGAQDYLIKGQIEPRGLLRALRYAIERKIMEEALFAEKERAQVTLSSIGDGVVCADILGNITFLNLVAEKTTGWSLQEAAGRPMVEIFRTRDSADIEAADTTAAAAILQIRAMHLPSSCVLIRRDGVAIPIEESIAPIHNREGQPIGAVIVFRDVSVAREMALQIAHSAQHDFLTGLPNRSAAERSDRPGDRLGASECNRQCRGAVLWIWMASNTSMIPSDIRSATSLLQSVGKTPGEIVCAARDTVSRQGGDEFVVLLYRSWRSAEDGRRHGSKRMLADGGRRPIPSTWT